jgi:hypothetical protein
MRIKRSIEVRVPLTPNSLSVAGEKDARPISDFTEAELRQLGAEWTEQLVKKARATPTTKTQ